MRCGVRSYDAFLSVEDSGPGIPQWAHERVFERFFRVQGTEGDGAGLGLAIVREVADQHAARVTVGNVAGSGTCVTLVFSVVTPDVSRRI